MQQFYIDSVKPGMKLGKTIYDDRNKELLKAGTELSLSLIERLKSKGFHTLCIDTLDSKDIILEDTIPITVRHQAITALRNLDIPSVMDSAKEIVSSICSSLNISFDLLDLRNHENFDYEHAVTVAEMSVAIGKELKDTSGESLFNQEQLDTLAIAALLHDIGKRCADKRVLEKLNVSKNNKDTAIQYSEKLIPVYGYSLLKDNILVNAQAKAAILFHKTDENGANMPIAIPLDKVHLFAKIIHVADTYDILVNQKNEKGLYFSNSEIVEYLMGSCGSKFNLDVVKTFVAHIPIYPKGTRIVLSDGREGIVYENKVGEMLRPKVYLFNGEILDLAENNSLTIVSTDVQRGGKNLC